MVTIGSDSRKRTHTFVAVDALGKKLGERTVPATTEATWRSWAGRSGGLSGCGPSRTVDT